MAFVIGFLLGVLVCAWPMARSSTSLSKSNIPIQDIVVLTDEVAELPCNTTPPDRLDDVMLVLWFREDLGTPIFSADARDVPLSRALVWYDDAVLGGRATFRGRSTEPSILSLRNVTLEDESVYRCRVDFRDAKSRNSRVNLTVIEPPRSVKVFTDAGQHVNGTAGPYRIGDRAQFTCLVEGGVPSPTVLWRRNGVILDEVAVDPVSSTELRSVISVGPFRRSDWPLRFTCLAVNSNWSRPLENTFLVDMQMPALSVTISPGEKYPTAGRAYALPCHVTGSRPVPRITWWRHGEALDPSRHQEITSYDGNVTSSVLNITFTRTDVGDYITCRADNPRLQYSAMEHSWMIELWYPPNVSLAMGRSLKAEGIKSGDDVYFDCVVDARPAVNRIEWRRNGIRLNQNATAGIIVTNQSLVLQNVARSNAGNITCLAANVEGQMESQPFQLNIKYAPVCRAGLTRYFGVSRAEKVEIACQVEANPNTNLSYKWFFNNSAELMEVPRGRYTVHGSASLLTYRPITSLDYGTLLCYATNDAGTQKEPCVFHILTAGPPEPVFNCSMSNQSNEVVFISCQPGFHGGLPQNFSLSFYDETSSSLISQYVHTEASFLLTGLKTNNRYRATVAAFNAKGRSEEVVLEISTVSKEPERQLEVKPEPTSNDVVLTPMLGILTGAVLLVLAGVVALVFVLRRQCQRQDSSRASQDLPTSDRDNGSSGSKTGLSRSSSAAKPLVESTSGGPVAALRCLANDNILKWEQQKGLGASRRYAALPRQAAPWPVGEPPPPPPSFITVECHLERRCSITESLLELHNPDIIPPPPSLMVGATFPRSSHKAPKYQWYDTGVAGQAGSPATSSSILIKRESVV